MQDPNRICNDILRLFNQADNVQRLAFLEAARLAAINPFAQDRWFVVGLDRTFSTPIMYSFAFAVLVFFLMGGQHWRVEGHNTTSLTLFSIAGFLCLYLGVGAWWRSHKHQRHVHPILPTVIRTTPHEPIVPAPEVAPNPNMRVIRREVECTPRELVDLYEKLVQELQQDYERRKRPYECREALAAVAGGLTGLLFLPGWISTIILNIEASNAKQLIASDIVSFLTFFITGLTIGISLLSDPISDCLRAEKEEAARLVAQTAPLRKELHQALCLAPPAEPEPPRERRRSIRGPAF